MEDNNYFPITSWAEEDRPREKLLFKGKAALSDAELIAILIGSGGRNKSAVELAKEILAGSENKLKELGRLSVGQLTKFKGIGEAKAVTIVAALELGRRRRGEEALVRKKITSSKDAFEIMQPIIGDLNHEEFWVIYLNNSNKVLFKEQSSKGGMTGTLVDPRNVFRKALEIGSTCIILAHNHPSGTLKASQSDLTLTKRLKMAGDTLEIKVLDHLIITQNSYFSFADDGIL